MDLSWLDVIKESHPKVFERVVKNFEAYETWINDLQQGTQVNCVYCGYNYGPAENTPATLVEEGPRNMREALEQHIATCPRHPMSALKREVEELRIQVKNQREVIVDLEHVIMDREEETRKLKEGFRGLKVTDVGVVIDS